MSGAAHAEPKAASTRAVQAVVLVALFGLLFAATRLVPELESQAGIIGAVGFLLLTGTLASEMVDIIGLPHLTRATEQQVTQAYALQHQEKFRLSEQGATAGLSSGGHQARRGEPIIRHPRAGCLGQSAACPSEPRLGLASPRHPARAAAREKSALDGPRVFCDLLVHYFLAGRLAQLVRAMPLQGDFDNRAGTPQNSQKALCSGRFQRFRK